MEDARDAKGGEEAGAFARAARPFQTLAALASSIFLAVSLSCASSPAPPAAAAPVASASASAAPQDEGPPVHPPPGWRRFVAEDEGFSVYMPGPPVVEHATEPAPPNAPGHDTPPRAPLLRAIYKDRETGCIYAVSYNDLDPGYIGHPDELFSKLEADPGSGVTLLESHPVTDLTTPGRDFRLVDTAADTILAMRVYVEDEHYYVVAVTFPRALFSEDAARRYLDTFRLTETP
jgi:hypothetical protein